MKFLLLMLFATLQVWGLNSSAIAQTQQQVVMQDYGLLLQLSPQTIKKVGEKAVHEQLSKEFGPLYAGYVQGQRQFIIRRSAVMASIDPLKKQVTQLFPQESLRSITNVDYETIEKSLTR